MPRTERRHPEYKTGQNWVVKASLLQHSDAQGSNAQQQMLQVRIKDRPCRLREWLWSALQPGKSGRIQGQRRKHIRQHARPNVCWCIYAQRCVDAAQGTVRAVHKTLCTARFPSTRTEPPWPGRNMPRSWGSPNGWNPPLSWCCQFKTGQFQKLYVVTILSGQNSTHRQSPCERPPMGQHFGTLLSDQPCPRAMTHRIQSLGSHSKLKIPHVRTA